MADKVAAIVKRALSEPITDIGQLTDHDRRILADAVRRGWLWNGKGGSYPIPKTVYARPGFDFSADRQRRVGELQALARVDAFRRARGAVESQRRGMLCLA